MNAQANAPIPGWEKQPSSSQQSAGGVAAESAPVATSGSDTTQSLRLAGQTESQMPVKATGPIAFDEGDGLPGGGFAKPDDNVSSNPSGKNCGFPDGAAGDGSGRQPKSVQGRTPNVHRGTGAVSAGLPPGFTPRK